MTENETRVDDSESSTNTTASVVETESDVSDGTDTPHEYETVDPDTRTTVLEQYKHRCQGCGRYGPKNGGLAELQVHHIERDPDGMDEHDPENLSVYCIPCHNWLHQRSTPDEVPVTLTDAESEQLLSKDIQILRFLAANGPARTGDIAAGVQVDVRVSTVRQRLWELMGLDNTSPERDQQLVDKDRDTGEWGLAEQIENSARKHIPADEQLLLQRMEDEQVRQALDRGCERRHVKQVFGISRRTTFNKMKRANAFDFPLSAVSNRGGRPSKDSDSGHDPEETKSEEDEQQRLDDVDEHEQDSDGQGTTETWGTAEAASPPQSAGDEHTLGQRRTKEISTEVRVHLRDAITALKDMDEAL